VAARLLGIITVAGWLTERRGIWRRLGFFLFLIVALGLFLQFGAPPARADDFGLPKAATADLKKLTLHVSQYHVVHAKPGMEVQLLDIDDAPLGVGLSREDFCTAALQGTVEVSGVLYSVAGKGNDSLVDCALPEFSCPRCAAFDLGSNRFVKLAGNDGLGAKAYGLVPYRTIAVKADRLKLGTVVYIPAARGLKLPNGKKHDGYFLVADFGAMGDNQIDLYTGTKPLHWKILGSGTARSRSVTAYVITDPKVVQPLKAAHTASAKAASAKAASAKAAFAD
jgi:3D (Asp-Asp-Asp) domain-containing protein